MFQKFVIALCLTIGLATQASAYPFRLVAGGRPAVGNGGLAIQAPVGSSNLGDLGLTPEVNRLWFSSRTQNMIRYIENGQAFGFAGNGRRGNDPLQDNTPALQAMIAGPTSISKDASGVVYFTQGFTGATLKYVTTDGLIHTAGGVSSIISSPADSLIFQNKLYIADTNSGTVYTCPVNPWTGCNTPTVFRTTLGQISGIAINPAGTYFYVTLGSGNAVKRFPSSGVGTLENVASGFAGPRGIAVASVNGVDNVFVADQGSNRVMRVVNGAIDTILGTGMPNSTEIFCENPPCDSLGQPFTPNDVATLDGIHVYASSSTWDGLVLVDLAGPQATATASQTAIQTATRTNTAVPTLTSTPSFIPTNTFTAIPTSTFTKPPTQTATATQTPAPTCVPGCFQSLL